MLGEHPSDRKSRELGTGDMCWTWDQWFELSVWLIESC
jgi:hypothetical protein